MILDILPESNSVNLGIKVKKFYLICRLRIVHISGEIYPNKYAFPSSCTERFRSEIENL